MKFIKTVTLKVDGGFFSGQLIVEDNSILLECDHFKIYKEGASYFFILRDIRVQLQSLNCLILINGSRKDVYPSRLSLQGVMAYVQTFGKQSSLEDLVNIFEETDKVNLVSTVEEHEKYHTEWIRSLG